jgi:uncharacterized OsmC-like protein
MQTFAGKPFGTMEELARLALADPEAAQETFTVSGEYGDVPHGHLRIERRSGFPGVEEIGVLAYEELLVAAVRCVGTDYLDYCRAHGVEVEAVRIEVEGRWDVRGMAVGLGLGAPPGVTPGWQQVTVRTRVRTAAPREAVERANRIAWETNVAAASLAAVPTRFEVTVEPPARAAVRVPAGG